MLNIPRFSEIGDEFGPGGDKQVMVSKLNTLDNFINGARTLEIQLDTGSPLSQNVRMDVFLLYDKILSISQGTLSVVQ